MLQTVNTVQTPEQFIIRHHRFYQMCVTYPQVTLQCPFLSTVLTFRANKLGMCCSLEREDIHRSSSMFVILNHFPNSQPQALLGIMEYAIIFYQYDNIINSYLCNLIIPWTARCLIGTSIISTSVFCPVCQ